MAGGKLQYAVPQISHDPSLTYFFRGCLRSWCKYLHSVQYIGEVDLDEEAKTNSNVRLRKSEWTVGVKGLRFR